MSLESCVNNINQKIVSPLISLLKVAVRSRRPSPRAMLAEDKKTPIIILGNGPSLRSFLDFMREHPQLGEQNALMAVNFAAITPEFFQLRPNFYVLADPHFFNPESEDMKVRNLWEAFGRCNWPMTLWLPLQHKKSILKAIATLPANITIKWMNLTPIEGGGILADRLIHSGLGMPRPRNVLIPAIICAMREGYTDVFIVGADHSWSKTLWVNDDNRVVSVQPHFYKDNQKEKERVEAEYSGYHLHDILLSQAVAFRSYFAIKAYAKQHGHTILNATPGSFIDAFPRCSYEQILPQ